MKLISQNIEKRNRLSGKISLLLLWLIGVPVPVLLVIFLFRGCSG